MINAPETYEVEVPDDDDEGDDGDAEDEDGESDSSVPKLELVPGQSSIEKDLSGRGILYSYSYVLLLKLCLLKRSGANFYSDRIEIIGFCLAFLAIKGIEWNFFSVKYL